MHLIDREKSQSQFLGDAFAITGSDPRCLNKVPPQLIRI